MQEQRQDTFNQLHRHQQPPPGPRHTLHLLPQRHRLRNIRSLGRDIIFIDWSTVPCDSGRISLRRGCRITRVGDRQVQEICNNPQLDCAGRFLKLSVFILLSIMKINGQYVVNFTLIQRFNDLQILLTNLLHMKYFMINFKHTKQNFAENIENVYRGSNIMV